MNKTLKLSLILVILVSILATPLFLNTSPVFQSEIKPTFYQKAIALYSNGTVIEMEQRGELQLLGYSVDGCGWWGPNPDTIEILHYKRTDSAQVFYYFCLPEGICYNLTKSSIQIYVQTVGDP